MRVSNTVTLQHDIIQLCQVTFTFILGHMQLMVLRLNMPA